MKLRLAAVLVLLAGPAAAEQRLPDCAALSRLWLSSYRAILKPRWPARELACAKADNQMTAEEVRDIDTARAAYVLELALRGEELGRKDGPVGAQEPHQRRLRGRPVGLPLPGRLRLEYQGEVLLGDQGQNNLPAHKSARKIRQG